MPGEIDRGQVQRLVGRGAQLVEVLPAEEYKEDHLPGAISLPLRQLGKEAGHLLDRNRPVIVYCWDAAWDMSSRAAWRLESLGFGEVYEYVAGKLDWMAAGLPTEGTNANHPRAGDSSHKDVPTCRMDERVGDVRDRVKSLGWDAVVVVNDQQIVLGLLRSKELDKDPNLRIEDAMRPGPSTFRSYFSIKEMAVFMAEHKLESAPVTTSDGRLVGLLLQADTTRIAGEQQ